MATPPRSPCKVFVRKRLLHAHVPCIRHAGVGVHMHRWRVGAMGVRVPLRARVNVCVCSGLGVASVSCTPFACGSIHDHESVLPPMRRRFFNAGQFLQAHTPGMGWLHVANDVCLVWSYVLLRLVDGVPLAWAFVQGLLALYRCATWLLHACSQRRAHA